MVLGDLVSKLETFLWISNYLSKSSVWSHPAVHYKSVNLGLNFLCNIKLAIRETCGQAPMPTPRLLPIVRLVKKHFKMLKAVLVFSQNVLK